MICDDDPLNQLDVNSHSVSNNSVFIILLGLRARNDLKGTFEHFEHIYLHEK